VNITQSDQEFDATIDEAVVAVAAAVNTRLFDKYGKREYTFVEVAAELDGILGMVKVGATEFYLYGKLRVI